MFPSDREFDETKCTCPLTANPSHLEANPVVLGKVRAKQEQLNDNERGKVLPVLAPMATQLLQAKVSLLNALAYRVSKGIALAHNPYRRKQSNRFHNSTTLFKVLTLPNRHCANGGSTNFSC